MCAHTHTHTSVCTHTHIPTHLSVHIHTHTHTHLCVHTHTHTHLSVQIIPVQSRVCMPHSTQSWYIETHTGVVLVMFITVSHSFYAHDSIVWFWSLYTFPY